MAGYIGSKAVNLSTTGADINGDANIDGTITSDGLTVNSGAANTVALFQSTDSVASIYLVDGNTTGGSSASQGLITTGNNLAVRAVNNVIIETGTTDRLRVDNNGDISFYEDTGTTAKLFWDASAESLGIGKTDRTNVSVLTVQNVSDVSTNTAEFYNDNGNRTFRFAQDTSGNADLLLEKDDGTDTVLISTHGDSYFNGGNVGIGVSSPTAVAANYTTLHLDGSSGSGIHLTKTTGGTTATDGSHLFNAGGDFYLYHYESGNIVFSSGTSATERMRIDSSGNLLVGKGSSDATVSGCELKPAGRASFTATDDFPLQLRRYTSDGDIVQFRKESTTVGSIGTTGNDLFVGTGDVGLWFQDGGNAIRPFRVDTQVGFDNAIDLGHTSNRFNDAFITNGVTTGSDGNDKQDIRDLTEAEQRVAAACKGLLKAWRWKSAVEEKGDDARIHCGIIAQDLQAAFAAEGLDAGRYAMFMSNTWWETQTEVPAVEAVAEVLDEEGNIVTEAVEAKDAYTRTDTYDTQEEAPEGATERTRLGVRYSELLAFIIGAL